MTSATDQIIERGLRAWTSGDLDALEAVLDPAVTLTWVEPGEWDCVGRDEVMWLLRQRHSEGKAAYPVSIEHLDEHTFIVSSTKPIDDDGPQPFPGRDPHHRRRRQGHRNAAIPHRRPEHDRKLN